MPRRTRKQSTARNFVEIVALMPWWAGVLAAVVFYGALHWYAKQPLTAITGKPGEVSALMVGTWTHSMALLFQYVLPILCITGSIVSALKRRKRKNLFDGVAATVERDAVEQLTWMEFELLIGEYFRRHGYRVVERGGSGADGGVDLVLHKDGEKYFVQCKQWKALKVGVDVVRQLKGVMAAHNVRAGFVVTSGRFTEEAIEFAGRANVELLDGASLQAMIRDKRRSKPIEPRMPVASIDGAMASCPECKGPMVRRTARRGASAGQAFWGCAGFPTCRGTRPAN